MPRKEKLPPREIAICERLAQFRREAKIPRSVFARTLGFISETIANYESARAPIRWDVFWAIHSHFLINPRWLATGEGNQRLYQRLNVDIFRGRMPDRDLLSDVWDNALKGYFDERDETVRELFFGPHGVAEKLEEIKRYLLDKGNRTLQSALLLTDINARLDFYSYEFSEALKADGTFDRMSTVAIYGAHQSLPPAKKLSQPAEMEPFKPSV